MKALLTFLFFVAAFFGNAQDTLAYSLLNDTTELREGSYVFKGPPVTIFNGERYVIEEATWYMTANYSMGRKHGTWRTFRKGLVRDTLMHETTYVMDTVQLVTKFSSEFPRQGKALRKAGWYQ